MCARRRSSSKRAPPQPAREGPPPERQRPRGSGSEASRFLLGKGTKSARIPSLLTFRAAGADFRPAGGCSGNRSPSDAVFLFLRLGARPHPGPDHPRGHRAPFARSPRWVAGFPREPGSRGRPEPSSGSCGSSPIFAVWFGRKHAQRRVKPASSAALRTNFIYALGARIPGHPHHAVRHARRLGNALRRLPARDGADHESRWRQWFSGGVRGRSSSSGSCVWTMLLGGLITWLTAKFSARSA